VLAVPGEITSALSAGTNALLRLGATPVTRAADVLEAFGLEPAQSEVVELGEAAAALLEHLRDGALTADELVRSAGVDPAEASAALMELELAQRVGLEDGVYRASV
jgi:DNA processing protein